MVTVGMVGLGLLGSVIARHLLEGGYGVQGFDVDPQRRSQLTERGGVAVSSPAGAAQGVDTCVLCLPNSAIVRDVCLGEGGVIEGADDGLVVVDCTTSRPDDTVRTAEALAAAGVTFLDASLSGSSKMAERRDVIALVGGDTEAYEGIAPVLDAFTRGRHHVGPLGAGATAKLVVNLVLGINRLALAEGLVLAEESGLDLPVMLDILRDSAAHSKAMDVWGQRMIDGDHFTSPGSVITTHAKDVRLILEHGDRLGTPLWLMATVEQVVCVAESMGLSEADSGTVVFEVLRRMAQAPKGA